MRNSLRSLAGVPLLALALLAAGNAQAHDSSGLSLTGGGKTVELTDFAVDPGASVLTGTSSVGDEVAAEGAPLFFLDGRTLNPLRVNDNGTAVLVAGFPASADEQRNQFVGVGASELAGGDPLEFPASLPHATSAPAPPDALLAASSPADALENADSDIEQELTTF